MKTAPKIVLIILVILAGLAVYWAMNPGPEAPEEGSNNATSTPADPLASAAYVNRKYGFYFESLPKGWSGYKEVETAWSGYRPNDEEQRELVAGPFITLEDLRISSVETESWQDIPIMIYTLEQWNKGAISQAAPVAPSEYGRNNKYVFILPARSIGFRDTLGVQEVSEWVMSKPMRTFEVL